MARAFVTYDRILPEVHDRRPWEKPTSRLVKIEAQPEWKEAEGRRPSDRLLVPKIRAAVDEWRASGYTGGSEVTRRLFTLWFEEEHQVAGFPAPFRYYFGQREAVETLAWLVECSGERDAREMLSRYATAASSALFPRGLAFQTGMDGRRQVRRRSGDTGGSVEQDLPPENLRRYAFKMATGSGKTWVMAMAIVWAWFHRRRVPGSDLSTNFLIVAPNIIVYQRLEKDFANGEIFRTLPLIPSEWSADFSPRFILRGEPTEPESSGNLFLTNIHQLYESREGSDEPANPVEALLGKKPRKDLAASGERSMLERLKSLDSLVVLNDEAHHVHDDDLAWSRSLSGIHAALPDGLSAWLDFSATPKDQDGHFFPWTVCDYPLAQAVEDRIVKVPIIVTRAGDSAGPPAEPDRVTKADVAEKYGYWLRAAVERWKEHAEAYREVGIRPVLFVVTERNAYADALAARLLTKEFGFRAPEVLVIHTDADGEIRKKDLDTARQAARNIDERRNRVKVVVSVMMLREGWDVRNVTVVLGLRPFTAKANILPEQVIGRGLRLMRANQPDRLQTVEVLGSPRLLEVLRRELEAEGIGVSTTDEPPVLPVTIKPLRERLPFDIRIPITKPAISHDLRRLADLDTDSLGSLYEPGDFAEPHHDILKQEHGTIGTRVGQIRAAGGRLPPAEELLSGITNQIITRAGLPNQFSRVYPIVLDYISSRLLGLPIDPRSETHRSHLANPEVQQGIVEYLAQELGRLTVVTRNLEFERADHRLSETRPFAWRRNLPPMEARKTVFNFVATFNDFERRFAGFLDRATDIARFAALGTTEQGASGTTFRVDYLKPSGAIGFYYPDWVAVQQTPDGERNWIIETKGRVYRGTEEKDEAMRNWCERVERAIGEPWSFVRVNQSEFDDFSALASLAALLEALRPAPTLPEARAMATNGDASSKVREIEG